MSLSRVIKSNYVGSAVKEAKAIPFRPIHIGDLDSDNTLAWTVDQAKRESDKLVMDAQQRSDSMLEIAQQQADSLFQEIENKRTAWEEEKVALQKQAYEEAFGQGYEEGREKGFADLFHSIEEAKQIVASSKEALQDHIEHNEHVILELAMKSAERILALTLEEQPDKFLSIVKKGIKEAREMREVKVYVALQQFHHVQQERAELRAMFPLDVQLYIYPEEELEPFQCFIESNQGRIDVSIDTQLGEMKQKLSLLLGDLG